MKTKSVNIMGSTGSIGTQALEICEAHNIRVNGISANSNVALLEKQIRKFSPAVCHVSDTAAGRELKIKVSDTATRVIYGSDTLEEFAVWDGADTLLNSVMGSVGLKSTVSAIRKGMKIALANKETLVAAGSIVMNELKKANGVMIPVDSEHSAIFQSLAGSRRADLKKIILTASGGPFYGKKRSELSEVTKEAALKHPNWSMGRKITVDSSTMMNKGLEIIEARWLFDTEDIEVVVQRESIIHSMVEFKDNSVIAQLGVPSMKIPIQLAFTWPERLSCDVPPVDFFKLGAISLGEPDYETFGCLRLAKEAMKKGGSFPLVMNGANEVAVSAFLSDRIKFLQIEELIERVMNTYGSDAELNLEECLLLDKEIRVRASEELERMI